MRYYLGIIISICLFFNSHGQEYTLGESKPYKKMSTPDFDDLLRKSIYLIKNKKDTIATYEILNMDYYRKSIKVNKLKGINNIQSKIKVDISTMGCCELIATYYYLITEDNTVIPLNKILNTECDGLVYKYDLIFPDDPKGSENSIYLGRLLYDKNIKLYPGKIKYRELISTVYTDKL